MENKVIQKIYIKSDESNETVKKEYTISELKELIAPTVMINLYYAALKPNYWFWQIKTDKIKGEIWRKCKHHNKYEASNYGRIRRILDAGKYEILEQYEEKKQKYTTSADIKKEIEENPKISDIGYLCVDIDTGKKKSESVYVYSMVADAWLVKPKNKTNLVVHHISNDGYDNCPYNLMYLSKNEHNSVHSGRLTGKIIPFHYRYPGPRKKLI